MSSADSAFCYPSEKEPSCWRPWESEVDPYFSDRMTRAEPELVRAGLHLASKGVVMARPASRPRAEVSEVQRAAAGIAVVILSTGNRNSIHDQLGTYATC